MAAWKQKNPSWFLGTQAFAMMPFVLYILIGGIFSVGLHYYSMKGLIFAAVISLLTGVFPLQEQREILGFCCAWIGAVRKFKAYFYFPGHRDFFQAYDDGKYRGGFIWLSLQLGITKSGFVVFAFLASAVISMGAGAPIAALFAVIPIFYPPGILLGASPCYAERSADQRNLFRGMRCLQVHR